MKILEGVDRVDAEHFFTLNGATIMRGNDKKLFQRQCRTNVRNNFFSNRTVASWNDLPNNVVNCTSTLAFKTQYDKHMFE
jgi:hypothetical protein